MRDSLTVRDIDPGDKSWLRREARRTGVSMEEVVRRLIHEKRTRTERDLKPSNAFAPAFWGGAWRRASVHGPSWVPTADILLRGGGMTALPA